MNREELLDIALRTLVANPTASLAEIAQAAGIGRATLHRHFIGRRELLEALAETAITAAEEALAAAKLREGLVDAALERALAALIPIGHRVEFLFHDEQLWEAPALTQRLDAIEAELAALIERGLQEGTLRSNLPTRWMLKTLICLLYAAWEQIRDGGLAPLDAPSLLCETLLRGFGRNHSDE